MSLPIGATLTARELEERLPGFEVHSEYNPECTFVMRAPRGWTLHHLDAMDRAIDAQSLTPLAVFEGPSEDSPPMFQVQAARLEREISAKNFMLVIAEQQGASLQSFQELDAARCDALLEQEIEGEPYSFRTLVAIDGDRAFYLTGVARGDRYEPLAETFGVMVSSFTVPSPTNRSIEPWEELTLAPGNVRCEHPASWHSVLADGSDEERAIVTLYGVDQEANVGGIIQLGAQRGRPGEVEVEYERVLEICAAQGVRPTGPPEEIGLETEGTRFTAIGSRRYPAKSDDLEQEILITLLSADDLALRVWLTTPTKTASFIHWATNRRALEIVLSTMA